MQLDREDAVLPGSTLPPRANETPPLNTLAAWFADSAPPVAVIVKKRRALDAALAASSPDAMPPARDALFAAADTGETADAGPGTDGERRPRVFVLPRDPAQTAEPGMPAGATPGTVHQPVLPDPATAPIASPAPRRRRRRPSEQRPSPVVRIVPPRAEGAPADGVAADGRAASSAGTPADEAGFVLALPALDAWQELQAALATVRQLVDDADRASRWRLAQPATRQRRRLA